MIYEIPPIPLTNNMTTIDNLVNTNFNGTYLLTESRSSTMLNNSLIYNLFDKKTTQNDELKYINTMFGYKKLSFYITFPFKSCLKKIIVQHNSYSRLPYCEIFVNSIDISNNEKQIYYQDNCKKLDDIDDLSFLDEDQISNEDIDLSFNINNSYVYELTEHQDFSSNNTEINNCLLHDINLDPSNNDNYSKTYELIFTHMDFISIKLSQVIFQAYID